MTITPEFIEKLRDRISLSSIIGKSVKLTKRGNRFIGLCPFHSEKTPSFNVNDDEGFFYCFGCGASGDVINYVRETNGLSFLESVQELADIAGLPMPEFRPQDSAKKERNITLLSCFETAAEFFQKSLKSDQGRKALDYLNQRGLTESIIEEFRLGYAPRVGLHQYLQNKGYVEEVSKLAGLTSISERDGQKYDYFRERVIFPIQNRKGQVIAFGARAMGDSKPKYLNSPESPSFSKKAVLYGWPQARERVKRNLPLLLVEGYMDVISVTASKKAAALAPLGTALTEEQITLAWKLHDEPILCFDGDVAGRNAANKAIEKILPILEPGKTVRIATLPDGSDPDDLIRHQGAEGLMQIIDSASSLLDATWSGKANSHDLVQPEQRALFWQEIRKLVRTIAHNQMRVAFGDEIERRIQKMRDMTRRNEALSVYNFNSGLRVNVRRPRTGSIRRMQILLGLLISFPQIAIDKFDVLSTLEFGDLDCEKLKNHLFDILFRETDLDEKEIRQHLYDLGYEKILRQIDGMLSDLSLKNQKAGIELDEAKLKVDEIISLSLAPRRR